MDTSTILLKKDRRGRVVTPPQRREELLAEFERSGLSAARFAAMAGVRYSTFATWVQQRRNSRPSLSQPDQPKSKEVRLVEVMLKPAATPHGLRVSLPGGAWLELSDAAHIALAARLIEALHLPATPC